MIKGSQSLSMCIGLGTGTGTQIWNITDSTPTPPRPQACWHPDPLLRPDMATVAASLAAAVHDWDWQQRH